MSSPPEIFNQDGSNKTELKREPTAELSQLFIPPSSMNSYSPESSSDQEPESDLMDPPSLESLSIKTSNTSLRTELKQSELPTGT